MNRSPLTSNKLKTAMILPFIFIALCLCSCTFTGIGDPAGRLLVSLAIILSCAKIGGEICVRLNLPAVLGEIIIGILLGNLRHIGFHSLDFVSSNEAIAILGNIGVIILLFEVGLESTVSEMMKTGLSSFLVALLGVLAPFGLGWAVGACLLPNESSIVHAFLGATLTATSVGITARVLKDLGKTKSPEARIILGAAVIDDVLGLLILAVLTGLIVSTSSGNTPSLGNAGFILLKAVLFLTFFLIFGRLLSKKFMALMARTKNSGVLPVAGLVSCFFLSWLAGVAGLATIVGAFTAGLIFEDHHAAGFTERGELKLQELIKPISSFLVPIFFIRVGMLTDVAVFLQPAVLGLAGALTLAAIAGKQVCGLGILEKKIDRLTVGIGMIPRGEVGLIFANMGLGLKIGGKSVISNSTYSAVVIVVMVTTLLAPFLLKWRFIPSSTAGKGSHP